MDKDNMSEQVKFAYSVLDYACSDSNLLNVHIAEYIEGSLPSHEWDDTGPSFNYDLIKNILNIALSTDEEFQRWKTPLAPDPEEIDILEETAEDLFQQLAALRKKIDELKGS